MAWVLSGVVLIGRSHFWLHNHTSIPTPWTLQHHVHARTQRSTDHLRIQKPQASTARQSHSFFHRVVHKWNALPLETHSNTNWLNIRNTYGRLVSPHIALPPITSFC
eukprot:GHVN01045074.1.p1 GENE.GHVN01045074.1~~GHVN01045074.1.p1  ORF type:complete len:107 (-),score=6.85 GHVN01045074.1:77-397(-)